MAKRQRGAARPGQLRPTTRRPQKAAGGSGTAVNDDIRPTSTAAAAGAVGAMAVAGTMAAASSAKSRANADIAVTSRAARAQASSLLAARAAEEYSYVVRDIRRIAVVAGGLIGVLLILFVLIDVLHVISL